MGDTKTRRVALGGLLFALAIVLSYLETLATPLLGLPPGVKLGLANTVVMYALLFLNWKYALMLVLLKAAFGALTRGLVAGLLSLVGGGAAFLVMALLYLAVPVRVSVLVLSVAGSVMHNAGQLAVVYFMLGPAALGYLPVLLASGIGMGVLTALLLRVLLPALQKAGLAQQRQGGDGPPGPKE